MRIAYRVSRVRIDGGLPAAQAAGGHRLGGSRPASRMHAICVGRMPAYTPGGHGGRARCSPDGRHLPGRIRDIGASGAVRHARRTRPVARRVPTPGRAAQPAGGRSPSCRSNRALSHSMNTRTLCGRLRFGRGRIDTGRAGSSKRLVEAARHASQRARARVRLDEVSRCLPQAETGEHRRDIRVRIVDRHGALHRDGLRLAVVDEAPYPRLAGVHRRVVDADVAVERIERLGHAVALQIRGRRARARRHRADPHHAIDALPTGSMSRSVSRKRRRPLRIRGTRADPR
ncbi:Uncharacterised protein [Burkholderia pseudomallei]|nr:Uncharacterised protein [Burkholderia pseudomallei]